MGKIHWGQVMEYETNVQTGLTSVQVEAYQKKYGANVFVTEHRTWLTILQQQIFNPFSYLLVGAAVLSLALGNILNGCIIFVFVLMYVVLGFHQEYQAEKTVRMLTALIVPTVLVRRNGILVDLATSQLVPGDLIILEPGDIIPADIEFIETRDVTVNEATLTGESIPVVKQVADRGYSGTIVTTGTALGIVTAIGKNSMLGSIAHATTQGHRESIFSHEITTLGRFVLITLIIILAAFFGFSVWFRGAHIDITELALFVIALAVTIIPEALPVVVSFCLARGAREMAKKNVVVRRLSAIQDLGSIDILCVDKTGTLTENKLSCADIWGDKKDVLISASLTNSLLAQEKKEAAFSFDAAILKATQAEACTIPPYEQVHYVPFDPESKRVLALYRDNNRYLLVSRGAPDIIVERCQPGTVSAQTLQTWVQEQESRGRRVLACAHKEVAQELNVHDMAATHDFSLVGLISFDDPVKTSAKTALTRAKRLGITIKIITGDSPVVARAVAEQIDLIKPTDKILTGSSFDQLSPAEQSEAAENYRVFARFNPLQKNELIKKMQECHNIGFLGEGINDAPAMKIAHVALAVNNAVDIAKESADVILLRKSLSVIIDGVEEGRTIVANTTKYLYVSLASTFSNFYTMAFVSFFIDFLPMLPLQILLVNILSDIPLIAIATDHVAPEDLKKPQTYHMKKMIGGAVLWAIMSSFFDALFFALFLHKKPAILQTSWFMMSILTEILFFYAIRTRQFFFTAQAPSRAIATLSLMVVATTLIVPLTKLGHRLFQFARPSGHDIMLLIFIAMSYFCAVEIIKYCMRKVQ